MSSGPVCGVYPGQKLSDVPTDSLERLVKQFGRNDGSRHEREIEIEQELVRRTQV